MELDYFQALNYFFQFAQFRNLPASTRLIYLAILHKWNATRRKPNFALSDRELSSLTGLGIGRVVTQAKRQLKNLGLIDFKSSKKGTTYTVLGGSHQTTKVATPPTRKPTHGGNFPNSGNSSNQERKVKEKAREGIENLQF